MAKEVIMPALGMAQETGTLLKWLKKEGEPVTKGEPLLEIETDKATVEIEAAATGILTRVTAAPGDEVPVGQAIAVILTSAEEVENQLTSSSSPPRVSTSSPVAARIAAEHNVDLSQVKPDKGRIQKADVLAYLAQKDESGGRMDEIHPSKLLASPKARHLARERGIDLGVVKGSGPDGAVLAADVEAAGRRRGEDTETREDARTQAGEVEPAAAQTLPVSAAWRVMVERLTRSWSSVPHFYLIREVEASRLITWRTIAQKSAAKKLTYTDLLIKVVASALRQHPRLNAAWNDGVITLNSDINIGLAVATAEGLVVPVIHRADTLALTELARRRQEIVNRANEGKLKPADLQGGTFTISNLGMYGVDAFNAIINPPQAAILAISRIAERVIPVEGQPAVRPMLTLSLSCDHRVVDGARGAQFLDTLAALIEEPLGLIS